MRISLLLQREPFGAILERTLARFWTEQLGREVTAHWQAGRTSEDGNATASAQTWLVNSYLNAIFVPDAERAIFDPIRREFSRSSIWWRRPAQQAYVAAALSQIGAPRLAQAKVQVSPAIPRAQQTLIVAGNHKIRLLDWAGGRAYGVLKDGFSPVFMQRELAARRQAAQLGLSVPGLQAVAEDGSWFAEDLVSGTPINRLARRAQVEQAETEAFRQLHTLHSATLETVALNDYLDTLRQRALDLTTANRLLSEEDRYGIGITVEMLARQIQEHARDEHVTTALAHGDFQPGNVLLADRQVWLIDWEYAARRQAGYDLLVYDLAARFPQGLTQRLRAFVADGWTSQTASRRRDWQGTAWTTPDDRLACAALFLLEELTLHLEENAQPPLTRLGDGLRILLREVTAWTRMGAQP